MSVTSETQRPSSKQQPGPASKSGIAGWAATVRRTMERPLTSYYLLLGASTMLLAIGLMMVLSSSSIYSYRVHDSSYYIFIKQLTWVLIGLPAAWLASRMNRKILRLLAWPSVLAAVALLLLTQTSLGFEVNGNRNWLALGPLTVQPSEVAKLSIILWSADVYAKKERLLGNPWHALLPVAPVVAMISLLVVYQRDLGTALVLFAILLGMLWVVGVPARLFGIALVAGGSGRVLPRGIQPRASYPPDQLHRPVQGLPGRRLAGRARAARHVQRRHLRQGPLRQPAEVGQPARGTHGLHLRRARRGARPDRHAAGARALRRHRVRRHPAGAEHQGPVRALRDRWCHHLVDVPDDHQRRHGAGPAAGDRYPAATRLLRWLRAGAVAGGARPARGFRARRTGGGAGAARAPR